MSQRSTKDPHGWVELLRAVDRVAASPPPDRTNSQGLVDELLAKPSVATAEVKVGRRTEIVVIQLRETADREGFAKALVKLGPPTGMDIVSPPLAGQGTPTWQRKHSVCHVREGRSIWFGLETTDAVEHLVSLAIHFESDAELPPPGATGQALFQVSTGWCGGHGEAILDDAGQIRRVDGLPLYLDEKSWELIRNRVDLSGSWSTPPVIRVSALVRVEERVECNASIPGAPKERFAVLVIESLESAKTGGTPRS